LSELLGSQTLVEDRQQHEAKVLTAEICGKPFFKHFGHHQDSSSLRQSLLQSLFYLLSRGMMEAY
jgi:hypothetical protein